MVNFKLYTSVNVYLLGIILNGFSYSQRFPSVCGICRKPSQSSLKDTLWWRAKAVKLLEKEKKSTWNVNDNHVIFGNFAFAVMAKYLQLLDEKDGWEMTDPSVEVFFFHSPGGF